MVKKHNHTNHAQIHGTRQKRRSLSKTHYIAFFAIIAVAALAYFGYMALSGMEHSKEDTVLVLINGEKLYQSELDAQWQALPVQAKLKLDKDQLLTQLIQERLLMQEAKARQITVSDEELQSFLDLQLQQTGTTEEQFAQVLEQQGTTIDDVKDIYRRQLTIAALFEQAIDEKPAATEEDVLAYYQENKEQFHRDEQVTVRHILIQQAENDTEMPAIVSEIEKSLDEANNTNFCDLVTNYSMDLGSRENCGEYTFSKGMMVPEFEEAGFRLGVGERETVKSQFGYHIMIKDADIPSGYAGLETALTDYPNKPTVQEVIEQTIIQEKARKLFDDFVGSLEADAQIVHVAVE